MCSSLEIEITTIIYVDVDDIIENFHLTSQSTDKRIRDAIATEIAGWDDCEYYLMGNEEEEKIFLEIKKRINNE